MVSPFYFEFVLLALVTIVLFSLRANCGHGLAQKVGQSILNECCNWASWQIADSIPVLTYYCT